jgi:hypothetical protein
MTASAQAALDAMAAAEDEAREIAGDWRSHPTIGVGRWARDRVRLIERDRDTLERHAATDYGDGQRSCEVCGVHSPCHDLQAVIRYWCHKEETA